MTEGWGNLWFDRGGLTAELMLNLTICLQIKLDLFTNLTKRPGTIYPGPSSECTKRESNSPIGLCMYTTIQRGLPKGDPRLVDFA